MMRPVFNNDVPHMHTVPIRHDTKAWKAQVWISFATAGTLCAIGLAYLPGVDIDRGFMIMGYAFCLSTAFAVAKFVRDNEVHKTDTPLWGLVVWSGFALAMALTGWGLARMEVNPTYKAFLGVCWLFLISSVFTLAKTLRDGHEAELAQAHQDGMVGRSSGQAATPAPSLRNGRE